MLLPCVGGAAFLPLMVGQRICTYVAGSNHFPEVGTPYILNEEFLSLVLWRKIQVKTNQYQKVWQTPPAPPKHTHRRVVDLEGALCLSIDPPAGALTPALLCLLTFWLYSSRRSIPEKLYVS